LLMDSSDFDSKLLNYTEKVNLLFTAALCCRASQF
jgi:hypothetical protein